MSIYITLNFKILRFRMNDEKTPLNFNSFVLEFSTSASAGDYLLAGDIKGGVRYAT
jgi:hypothetical protein